MHSPRQKHTHKDIPFLLEEHESFFFSLLFFWHLATNVDLYKFISFLHTRINNNANAVIHTFFPFLNEFQYIKAMVEKKDAAPIKCFCILMAYTQTPVHKHIHTHTHRCFAMYK